MDFFVVSLCLFIVTALVLGVAAIYPKMLGADVANKIGSFGSALSCLIGFIAITFATASAEPQAVYNLPWGLPEGAFSLCVDQLSRVFMLPVFGLGLVCSLSGGYSLAHESGAEHNLAAHWFFFAILLLGMIMVCCAADAVLFMIVWEVMSLSPFFLIDFNDGERKVRDAAWVYLVAAHLGAVALLAFFALLWQTSGTTSFIDIASGKLLVNASPLVVNILFVLALIGFGAKAGILPLHIWLPEAHPAAPSHVSALMSGAMINAGLYGVIRSLELFSVSLQIPEWWAWLIFLVGLCTGIVGILKALAQSNLKRLLAYSSVENMGLMFVGLGVGMIGLINNNPCIAILGYSGLLLHMLNHAGFKGLLFLCAGEVLHSTGTLHMAHLGGLQKKLPFLGCCFAIGATSISCLPPFSGFASEFSLVMSMINANMLPGVERQVGLFGGLAVVALISGLGAALYAKAYSITFLGHPRSGFATNLHTMGLATLWPLFLPVVSCVAGGLLAPVFFGFASSATLTAIGWPKNFVVLALETSEWLSHSLFVLCTIGMVCIFLVIICYGLRIFLLRKQGDKTRPVWSCGYQIPSPRIQYTADSFSEPLSRIFNPIMGLQFFRKSEDKLFPKPGQLQITAPDRLRIWLFNPLFEMVERASNFCKILQHGKIHVYILYIFLTVVGLLIWGLAQ